MRVTATLLTWAADALYAAGNVLDAVGRRLLEVSDV